MLPPVGPADGTDAPAQIERARLLRDLMRPAGGPASDPLADLAGASFRVRLLEALTRTGRSPSPRPADGMLAMPKLPPPSFTLPPSITAPDAEVEPEPVAPLASGLPRRETDVIRETAAQAGIDVEFLTALRKIENGGPGREFGVLSVPAPTYEAQARVAAETIRRNLQRFEAAGGTPIDAKTGRYTEEFIRFFSARYAPLGAANDPTGLNRHHAPNLIRRYAQLAAAGTAA